MIIGYKTAKILGLLKDVGQIKSHKDLQDYYKDVFKILGCIGEPQHLTLKPDVEPVIHLPCKVHIALRSKIKELRK